MRKLPLVVVVAGCWTSSSAPPRQTPVETTPKASASTGGEGYGGSTYARGGAFASLTGTSDLGSGFDDTEIYGGLLGADPQGSASGLGGLGGGGVGVGGSIGTGSGIGRLGGRTAGPTATAGQPTVANAGLDKAIIRRYIRRHLMKIRFCYEKELVSTPALAGTVTAKFTIDGNGNVSSSTASGLHVNVDTCIANVIRAIQFPKPQGGGAVSVSYPFVLQPAPP